MKKPSARLGSELLEWPVLISGMLVVTSCVPFHATHRFVYAVHSGSLASNHLQL